MKTMVHESSMERMRRRATNKKKQRKDRLDIRKPKNIAGSVILLVQLIASVVFIGYLERLDALPMKYFSLIFGALMFMFVLGFILYMTKKMHILGKIIGVVMCICLIVGNVYMHKTVATMKKINSAGKYATNEFSVAVLKDSSIKEIKDLTKKKVGIMKSADNEARNKAVKDINSRIKGVIVTSEYSSISELIEALHAGEVDAAMYKSSYTTILEEADKEYSSKIRVIDKFLVETEIKIEEHEKKDPNSITQKPFVLYLSGTDEEGKVALTGRSDVNILVVVNPKTHKILMVSTPRDYYVEIPGVTEGNMNDKLTHAGNEGVETSIATLENLYGVDVDYFAKLNFTSFCQVIDIIGGINVNSEYEFTTTGGFYFKKGYNNIKEGIVALQFVRERYAFADGDAQRGKNQMAVVKAVIDKVTSPAILTSYMDILDASSDIVQTNMPTECFTQLVKMQLDENCKWSMESVSATGEYGYRVCYQAQSSGPLSVCLVDWDSISDISDKINEVINGK